MVKGFICMITKAYLILRVLLNFIKCLWISFRYNPYEFSFIFKIRGRTKTGEITEVNFSHS